MARARTRTLAVLALLTVGLGAASPLAGCSGSSSGPDCSATTTKTGILGVAESWYLFSDLVDFAAFDPARADQTPAQLLEAIVDSANAPDRGRGFSYLTTKAASSQLFDEGTSLGFGIGLRFVGTTQLFVTQVFGDAQVPGGSPAAQAGFARGDEILAIAPGVAPFPSATSLDAERWQMAAILAADAAVPGTLSAGFASGVPGTTRDFRLRKVDGTEVDVQATTAVYSLDPVPRAAAPVILDAGGKKVGYLVLRTFINPAVPLLRQAFADFKAKGVTDLIVDLRYNGGGLLDVATVFLDLMGAGHTGDATTPGDLQFELLVNTQQAAQRETYRFGAEVSAVAPARVAFIVTEGSASASELMVFALLPYLGSSVAVVGERTFGKPVGQFGFAGPDCPTLLYLLAFQLANRDATAEYFQGLPDVGFLGSSCAAPDDLTHRTSDPAEASTAAALQWIASGTCPGGPIPPAAATLARRAAVAAFPEPPEPSLAQRHIPGLY